MENEKTKINKVLLCLFLCFWVFTILDLIFSFSTMKLILTILIYLPMTAFMLLNKHSLAILILILYAAFEIVMNLLGIFSIIANKNFGVINISTIVIGLLLFIAIIDDCIKILRGKDVVNKWYLYVLLLLYLIIMTTGFIIDITKAEFTFNTFIKDIIVLVSSTILINVYIVYYLNETQFEEIEVFK